MKRMKKGAMLWSLLLCCYFPYAQSQNLIANGGFEAFTDCPNCTAGVQIAGGSISGVGLAARGVLYLVLSLLSTIMSVQKE